MCEFNVLLILRGIWRQKVCSIYKEMPQSWSQKVRGMLRCEKCPGVERQDLSHPADAISCSEPRRGAAWQIEWNVLTRLATDSSVRHSPSPPSIVCMSRIYTHCDCTKSSLKISQYQNKDCCATFHIDLIPEFISGTIVILCHLVGFCHHLVACPQVADVVDTSQNW